MVSNVAPEIYQNRHGASGGYRGIKTLVERGAQELAQLSWPPLKVESNNRKETKQLEHLCFFPPIWTLI